jgi:hypothetical protein
MKVFSMQIRKFLKRERLKVFQNEYAESNSEKTMIIDTREQKNRKYVRLNASKEQLEADYKELNNCDKIGLKYGVSGAAIRNRFRKLGIEFHTTWTRGGHNIIGDMIGQKFCKLTVLEKADQIFPKEAKRKISKEAKWLCVCDCGNQKIVGSNALRRGISKSCGCLQKEKNASMQYKEISHAFWMKIIRAAESRSFVFEINQEYAWNLFLAQNRKCALSGVDIFLTNPFSNKQTASLDRIDSLKGYIEGNVQWVHKKVNILKNNVKETEFIEWCRKIYENSLRKNNQI